MKVKDIMRPVRWTVAPEDSLGRAVRIMAKRREQALLVAERGALVGLLSERNLLDYRASESANEDWSFVPVRRAMQAIAATVDPDESVASAVVRLAKARVEILPVVEHGYLIGQLTATDLFESERIPSEPSPRPLTAADAMTGAVFAVRPSDSLLHAAMLMVEHQVRHLPVVDQGSVVGMLSDRDIRPIVGDPVRYAESREREGARTLTVRDAMVPTALTFQASRPLRELAHELADERIGALPIVDSDGKLIGIVSYVDVLRALAA